MGGLVLFTDVGELYKKQKELEYQGTILRTIIDTLPEFIFYKDNKCRYLGYNKKWKDYYSEMGFENILGKTDLEIGVSEELALDFIKKDKEVMESGKPQYIERKYIGSDREIKFEECIKVPVINEKGETLGVVGLARDVTEQRKMEETLKYLSYVDILTGLNNRTSFEIRLKELNKEENLPLGVIMGDVNGLKIVNDTFGHLEGDRLLKDISNVIKIVIKESGYAFRWGGDEFVILIPNANKERCEEIKREIIEMCKAHSFNLIELSISLGSSVKGRIEDNIDISLREAEEHLYRQKLLEERSVRSSIVFSLQKSLEEKNMETEKHTERLINYALQIGRTLKLSMDELYELELVTKLHDIGKIGISEEILLKPGKLTDKEFSTMKTHTEKGYRILKTSPELAHISKGVLSHHERWDGKGYPLGLKGEEIPLAARIVNLVDSYDAMTHDRVYSKARTKEDSIREIRRCKGTQFDPYITDIFLSILEK